MKFDHAVGAITGIGNALPREVLRLITFCERAAAGEGGSALSRSASVAAGGPPAPRRTGTAAGAPAACAAVCVAVIATVMASRDVTA